MHMHKTGTSTITQPSNLRHLATLKHERTCVAVVSHTIPRSMARCSCIPFAGPQAVLLDLVLLTAIMDRVGSYQCRALPTG